MLRSIIYWVLMLNFDVNIDIKYRNYSYQKIQILLWIQFEGPKTLCPSSTTQNAFLVIESELARICDIGRKKNGERKRITQEPNKTFTHKNCARKCRFFSACVRVAFVRRELPLRICTPDSIGHRCKILLHYKT